MLIRRMLTVALVAVAALTLASCMSVRGELTLDRQARASGQMTVELTKQVAALAGITSVDAMRSQVGTPRLGSNVQVIETDTAYRMTGDLDHQALNDPTGLSAVVDSGSSQGAGTGQVVFSMTLGDQSTQTTEDASLFGDMTVGNLDLTVHFPGRVQTIDGPGAQQVDDHTVRIKTPLTTATMNSTWRVTSAIDPAKPTNTRLLVGVAILAGLLVICGGSAWWWSRQRRSSAGQDLPTAPLTPIAAKLPEHTEPAEPKSAAPPEQRGSWPE
jgi:outer membrane murein-binding lipoprotein Lpp